MRFIKRIKSIFRAYKTIDELVIRVDELGDDVALLAIELGEIPSQCDKCDGDSDCFKCEGTGVVKRSQLFGWEWW